LFGPQAAPGALFGALSVGGKVAPEALRSDFDGCISATALDTSQIRIIIEHPEDGSSMSILRDGISVARLDAPNNVFTDERLSEGREYTYVCEATVNGMVRRGKKSLTLSTVSVNPPQFGGLVQATATSARTIEVRWNPALNTGPVVSEYRIYASLGTTIDWSAQPRAVVQVGTHSAQLGSLGDQLPYVLGVRACTAMGICDANTVTTSLTTPNGGAPLTTGVSSVTANNGRLAVIAPWSESLGAILRRRVYLRTGPVGGLTLADYTLARTEFVSNLASVPTVLYVSGVSELTTYHVIVVDEDPSGAQNLPPQNFFTINTGDMTPPNFSGASSIALVAGAEDRQVDLSFTAVSRQNADEYNANGTAQYMVYVNSALYPSAPSNACELPSPFVTFSSDTYAPGLTTFRLQGLSERRVYSICLKASDNAGNISTNTNALTVTTRDITAPLFDGVQSLDYLTDSASMQAQWNASPSADVSMYRVKLWKNVAPASVTDGQITTFMRSASSFANGWTIAPSDYAVTDFDTVYIVVDACDDANIIPGGVAACTSFAHSTARTLVLPDVTPPQGFLGVAAPGSLDATVQGEVTVRWSVTAGQWGTGYAGFRVFDYNTDTGALTFLKDCSCDGPCDGTGAGDTACVVDGLNAYRTYRFHVRAYDGGGNLTQLNPLTSHSAKRTVDTTAPFFSSSLTVGAAPTFTLSWDAATDNQYAQEPGAVINYQVWRKTGSAFTNPNAPSVENGDSLRVTQSTRSYTDSLLEATTHYYVVCAVDMAGNRACDGANVRFFTTTDLTAPTVSDITTTWDAKRKRWDLNWTMTDAGTPSGSLLVSVYRRVDSNAFQWATTTDEMIVSAAGITSATNLTGPANLMSYISYLVVVRDQAGNTRSKKIRMKVDNRLSVTSVRRTMGPLAGGNWIHVRGTGFTMGSENGYGTSSTVSLGGSPCTNVTVFSADRLICQVPAGAGPAEIRVTNPDGTMAAMAAAYTYTDISSDPCDLPANRTTGHPTYGGGNGTSAANPYLICTAEQFASIPDTVTANGHYKLGDNINLSSTTTWTQKTFSNAMSLNGDGLFLSNYTGTNSLFGTAIAGSKVSNVSFYNFTVNKAVTAGSGTMHGVVFVTFSGVLQNVGFTGTHTITGTTPGGGDFGGFSGGLPTGVISQLFIDITIHANAAGAYTGVAGLASRLGGSLSQIQGRSRINISTAVTTLIYTGGVIGGWDMSASAQTLANENSVPHGINDVQLHAEIDLPVAAAMDAAVGGLMGRCNCNSSSYASGTQISNVHMTGSINHRRPLVSQGGTGGIVGWYLSSGTFPAPPFVRTSSRMNIVSRTTGGSGGLIGRMDVNRLVSPATFLLEDSFFVGSIGTDGSTSGAIGGLIGRSTGTDQGFLSHQNNLVVGSIEGGTGVGGLFGLAQSGSLFRSAFFGTAVNTTSPSSSNLAALIRYSGTPTDYCADSYWDVTIGPALGNTPSVCPSGDLTTAETKVQANFGGLDFTSTWKMTDPEGRFQGRPILQWMEDE
jgi:hypothetical protein